MKPDATPEEVRAVVNDEQGGQIFSQAVGFFEAIPIDSDAQICFVIDDELKSLWRIPRCIPRSPGTT